MKLCPRITQGTRLHLYRRTYIAFAGGFSAAGLSSEQAMARLRAHMLRRVRS